SGRQDSRQRSRGWRGGSLVDISHTMPRNRPSQRGRRGAYSEPSTDSGTRGPSRQPLRGVPGRDPAFGLRSERSFLSSFSGVSYADGESRAVSRERTTMSRSARAWIVQFAPKNRAKLLPSYPLF